MGLKAGVLLTFLASCCPQGESPAAYDPADKAWVDKAAEWGFGSGAAARREALETTDPVVVHLSDRVCVALKLRSNSLGGDSAVCFSRADGKVVASHTEGE